MRFNYRNAVWVYGSFIFFTFVGCSNQAVAPKSIEAVQSQLNKFYPNLVVAFHSQDDVEIIHRLINQPLTPQTSVQLMLINSPRIDAELTKLGVADAGQVQARLISNPRFSLALLKTQNAKHWLWDIGLTQPLLEIFTRSTRQQQAATELLATQLEISRYLQTAISELEQEYFSAIADQQNLALQETVRDAEFAKHELAEKLYKAGNISQLNYLFYLRSLQQQARVVTLAQLAAFKSKSNLMYRLGLTTEAITLPNELPTLPQELFDANTLIAEAKNNRLDIQLGMEQQQRLNQQLILVKKQYGIADSSLGLIAKRDSDSTRSNGVEVEVPIPLFDNGDAKIAVLHAQISSKEAEIKDINLRIARDIQQSTAMLNTTRTRYVQIKREHETVEKRVDLAQQEVNFMLSSPFELIELKSQSIQFEQEANLALLDYWQARSQLELIVGKQLVVNNIDMSLPKNNTQEHNK